MNHTDTAAEYARAYSEIVLCRMVLGLPEMKAATLQKRQKDIASNERPGVLNLAIRRILVKHGHDTSGKEVQRLLPANLQGSVGMKDRVSREKKNYALNK